jgi:hypothetical protein
LSHQPERKEKDCLNCGAEVLGRYCQVCGQENIVTQQNFWSLGKHFIYDIFHFDGKFFDTLKYLITKPGRVPREYVAGKRMSYLDPIRMYLFTSALFFLIFFTFRKIDIGNDQNWSGRLSVTERLVVAKELRERERRGVADSFEKAAIDILLDSTKRVYLLSTDSLTADSLITFQDKRRRLETKTGATNSAPDSSVEGKNWLKRILLKKGAEIERRYDNDSDYLRAMLEQFLHRIPYILFASLPFFALILKLLYRRRSNFHYHEHIIFTLYHYIFSFMLMLVLMGLIIGQEKLEWGIFGWLIFAVVLFWFIYLYKGMRNFYNQSRSKTLVKFFLLNFLGFVILVLLLLTFFFVTAIQT